MFGCRVWYRDYRSQKATDKFHRVWEGPGEILHRLSRNTYLVATERGELALDSMRLKPYLAPEEGAPRLHYYIDQEFLVESDKYVTQYILSHQKVGRGPRKRIEWELKYRGFPNTAFQPASAFMHDINDIWRAYNKKHGNDQQLINIRCLLAQSAQGSQLEPEFCHRLAIQTNQAKEWKAMVAEKNKKTTQKTGKRMEKLIFLTSETSPRFCATVWRGRRKTQHTQQHNRNNERKQRNRLVHAPNQ